MYMKYKFAHYELKVDFQGMEEAYRNIENL